MSAKEMLKVIKHKYFNNSKEESKHGSAKKEKVNTSGALLNLRSVAQKHKLSN